MTSHHGSTEADETSESATVSKAQIEAALDDIIDPCSAARGTDHSIVSMGLLKSIAIEGGAVTVNMRLTSPLCFMVPYFIRKTEERIGSLQGVESVELVTDSGMEWTPDMMHDDAKERRERYLDKLEERHGSAPAAQTESAAPPWS